MMQGSEAIHPNIMAVEAGVTYFYIGQLTNINVASSKVHVQCSGAEVLIHFLHDSMFRVKLNPKGPVNEQTTDAVYRHDWPEVAIELKKHDDYYQLVTKELEVHLTKDPFRIRVFDAEGQLIHQDDPAKGMGWNEKKEVFCYKTLEATERFYGLGEKTGYLNKRDTKQVMWNSDVYIPHNEETNALYQSIPFFASVGQQGVYGIYFDNPARTEFDFTNQETYSFKAEMGELDYYFFHAESMKGLVQKYTELTGRMPLPPKWALGYQQSRYSYETEDEVRRIANTLRTKEIPCDVIYLDIHYMDGYRVFTWHPSRFPNGAALIQELAEQGFHVVPIVDPGVKKDPNYRIYQEGIKKDMFCRYLEGELYSGDVWPGESVFPDFTEQNVRQWWGELHEHYTQVGIKGIWNDMNEPAVFNETKTMDVSVMHRNDGEPKTHQELHNLYGYYMSKATFEALQKQLQGERPFVLTRAGFAGIQRYAAVWTGDNRSFWDHLAMSIPMFLNMGISGLPFVGADIGGFAHPANGPLLARWTQLGAFSPYCRNHSALDTPRQEPWVFGAEIEAICKKYIELRYRLLPHVYTLFEEASRTGVPVLRALVMEYPEDGHTYNLSDQLLVGDSILVAPVYRPDTEYRVVYLPAGEWVNFWTDEVHQGGQHIMMHTPLDVMPILVKAGSIHAQGPVVQHVGEMQGVDVQFHVYPSVQLASYEWYEDDGLSYSYEQGAYNRVLVEAGYQPDADDKVLHLSYNYAHQGYESGREQFHFVIHCAGAPQAVESVGAGEALNWEYDQDTGRLTIYIQDQGGQRAFKVLY